MAFARSVGGQSLQWSDLRGARVAAADAGSLGGYLAQAYELDQLGLTGGRGPRVSFTGTHEAVVRAVLRGEARAGFVRTGVLEAMADRGELRLADLVVIPPPQGLPAQPFACSTRSYPEWPLMRLAHVDPARAQDVAVALYHLRPDDPAARAAGYYGWTTPANYQPVHDCLRTLRVGPYVGYGHVTASALLRRYWPTLLAGVLSLLAVSAATVYLGHLNRRLRAGSQRLQASEGLLSATLCSIGDAVITTDAQGLVTSLNPVAQRLTGWAMAEAVGRPAGHVLPLRDPASGLHVTGPVDQVLAHGRTVLMPGHCTLTRRDGTSVDIADSCAPIREPGGRIVGAVMVFRDVSAELALQRRMEESEARFRALFVGSPDAYLLIRDGVIVDCNDALTRMLGCDRDGVVGRRPEALSPPEQPDGRPSVLAAAEHIAHAVTEGSARFEWLHLRADGGELWVDVSLRQLDLLGQPHLLVTWRDITARRAADRQLRKLSMVVEQTPASVVITDRQGNIEYVNPAFTRNTGYTAAEVRGQNPRVLKSGLMPPETYADMWAQITAGRPWRGELQNRRKNGELFWELAVISPLQDERGATTNYLAVKENISDLKLLEDELRSAARTDRLTGLPNRALFHDRLQNAVLRAQRVEGYHFAVLFLDFDRFKAINDTLGHEAGDTILCEIARRLRETVRAGDSLNRASEEDTAARFGGDEFVVLLDGIESPGDAAEVAERLLDVLAAPYHVCNQDIFSTVSIGICTSTTRPQSAEEVLRDADTAMYEAKLAGRGRALVFDVSMHQRVHHRVALENDLRRALGTPQLFLQYQPIVCLQTAALVGCEALLRWRHPQRGLVSPAEFIPIAEESGLIVPLGEWVLREACTQLQRWHAAHPSHAPPAISVNVSRRQLLAPSLPQTLRQVLHDTGLDAPRLHLEVTESAVMSDAAAATAVLRAFKQVGVQLAMDDFGTGYSSLACLHQFPLDVLKIDRSFVGNIERGRDFAALVHAVTQLAHNMNIRVVAEGIETLDQALLLQSLDCEFGQGYFFSRPIDPDHLPDLHIPALVAGAQSRAG